MSGRKPDTEPIPGYRLIAPLGKGGFGEVWKCEAPGGLVKAIKFVRGDNASLNDNATPSTDELRAIQRIKDLRHPFLLSIERIERFDDELVIIMELADRSLHDVLEERQHLGHPGLPREQVLAYLEEAAEVLDLMNFEYGLQHLDVKPRNLFLVRGHVKVADFGLVQSLSDAGKETTKDKLHLSMVTPLYAAPELFQNKLSERCDQYSLAIVYQELLTGSRPIDGKNVRQLMMQHTLGKPDLSALPEQDRDIIARALSKNPQDRFGSCTAMVLALAAAALPEEAVCLGGPPEPPSGSVVSPTRMLRARTATMMRPKVQLEAKGTVAIATTRTLGPAEARFLPDYKFTRSLSRDPRGETWQAQAGDGRRKVVHVLYGVCGHGGAPPAEAIAHLQTLRHPALLPTTVVPGGRGALMLVTDLVEGSLRQRYQECQGNGEGGIPRGELLDRLERAAEALDQLYQQQGLQHLELNPGRILLDGERVLLDQLGVAQLLWGPAGVACSQSQLRYNAPERAQGLITRSCDQFSLGVIYQEMLTGKHPFHSGAPSLGRGKVGRSADLQPLPTPDRAVVARALDLDPERRFASCVDFVRALRTSGGKTPTRNSSRPASKNGEVDVERLARREQIAGLIAEARDWLKLQQPESEAKPVPAETGQPVLEQRLVAVLPPEGAVRKFDGFRKQWDARVAAHGDGFAIFHVGQHQKKSWFPWRNHTATLKIEVRWTRPSALVRRMPEVQVRIGADNPACQASAALLPQLGPLLLESLQTHLLGAPERRNGERILWPHEVAVSCVTPGRPRGTPTQCQGKDLSLTGMGLYMPVALPSSQVQLCLTSPTHNGSVVLPASIVRIQRWDDRLYEVGVVFE